MAVRYKMPVKTDSRMGPLTLKVLAHISDGEWHEVEDVIDAIQYTISPGEAHRIGEAISTAKHKRDMDDLIASGRRHLVVNTINSLVQNSRLERNTTDRNEVKKVRMAKSLQQVFVVRSEDGTLTVHSWGNQDVAIHVVDAWAATEDPATEAARVKEIFEAIPRRIEGRERIQKVCRSMMSRLNVAAALGRFDHITNSQPYTDQRED